MRDFFFFQAEDGIRDVAVTGVQTCALPISRPSRSASRRSTAGPAFGWTTRDPASRPPTASASGSASGDRKSTRLNSSHGYISYAVFCLKKKKKRTTRVTDNDY